MRLHWAILHEALMIVDVHNPPRNSRTFIGNVHRITFPAVTKRLRVHGIVSACHVLREGNPPWAMGLPSRFT